jgi:catechol 2,3-dioxygenase-like lactoylglutathione lyase family enzyme
MKVQKIDHVSIVVSNLAAAKGFFLELRKPCFSA